MSRTNEIMVCSQCGHAQTDHTRKDEVMYLPDDKTMNKYDCRLCKCNVWGIP